MPVSDTLVSLQLRDGNLEEGLPKRARGNYASCIDACAREGRDDEEIQEQGALRDFRHLLDTRPLSGEKASHSASSHYSGCAALVIAVVKQRNKQLEGRQQANSENLAVTDPHEVSHRLLTAVAADGLIVFPCGLILDAQVHQNSKKRHHCASDDNINVEQNYLREGSPSEPQWTEQCQHIHKRAAALCMQELLEYKVFDHLLGLSHMRLLSF